MKLRNGTGKIGVYFAQSEDEVTKIVDISGYKRDDFVVQDFYFGPAYSAEVWRDTHHEIFFGITNRSYLTRHTSLSESNHFHGPQIPNGRQKLENGPFSFFAL